MKLKLLFLLSTLFCFTTLLQITILHKYYGAATFKHLQTHRYLHSNNRSIKNTKAITNLLKIIKNVLLPKGYNKTFNYLKISYHLFKIQTKKPHYPHNNTLKKQPCFFQGNRLINSLIS